MKKKRIPLRDANSRTPHLVTCMNFISRETTRHLQKCGAALVAGCQGRPHGVIYTLKFLLRAKSPLDYIDLILSMPDQPNITIRDLANMLVARGNKRKKNMFHPFNGMVAEMT